MSTFKNISFCISIALLCVLGACKKSNNDTPIDANLIKYFDYQVGTYWIMKDSISGRVDSFFVTSNQFYNSINGNNQNTIGIGVSEYTNGVINIDGLKWGISLSSNWFLLTIESPNTNFIYITNSQPLFTYPFIADASEIILSSYNVAGNTYSSVAQIIKDTEGPNSTIYAYNDSFYINTDAGFVKIRLSHPAANINYVWELQKYNIVH